MNAELCPSLNALYFWWLKKGKAFASSDNRDLTHIKAKHFKVPAVETLLFNRHLI